MQIGEKCHPKSTCICESLYLEKYEIMIIFITIVDQRKESRQLEPQGLSGFIYWDKDFVTMTAKTMDWFPYLKTSQAFNGLTCH